MVGFAVAVFGAFISFLPLLQILLPLKVAAIAPNSAATLLSTIIASGAVIAGVANFAIGWLSDHTPSRFGRRRAWIFVGLLGILLSYVLFWRAQSGASLFVALALFQLAFNAMFSPLLALVADRVRPERRGRASALIALGSPIGTLAGAIIIGSVFLQEAERFLALGVIVFASIAPFTLLLGADPDAPSPSSDSRPGASSIRWLSANFMLGCLARGCVLAAFTVAQFYVLLYVQATLPHGALHATEQGVVLLSTVFGVVSALTGIIMGQLSDRLGRRKPIVIVAALMIGAAMMLLSLASSWPAIVAAYALFATGAGAHTAVEFALMIDILPSPDRTARDLGILNLSNIVPQIVAPLAIGWILAVPGATIHWAFAAGGMAAMLGAGLVALMRSVP